MAGSNLYGAARDAKRACQRARQFFISRTINGGRGNAHAKRAIMCAYDVASAGARDNAHGEGNRVIV